MPKGKDNQESENRLDTKNCNKKMCKSCIFRSDGKQFQLSPERFNEIQIYLATGKSSHICHVTELTCYGSLAYQAQIFQRMGMIPEPTVESLLEVAGKYLRNEQY